MRRYSLIAAAIIMTLCLPALLHVTSVFSDTQLELYYAVIFFSGAFLVPSSLVLIACALIKLKLLEPVPGLLNGALMLLRYADRLSFYSTVTATAVAHVGSLLVSTHCRLETQKSGAIVGAELLKYLELSQGTEWSGLTSLVSDLALFDLHSANTIKARNGLRRARKLAERAYVEDDDNRLFQLLLFSMENLATVECSLGHYTEAINEYRKCIDVRENKLGPIHWSVGTELCRLAEMYMRGNDYREAKLCLERAQTILENCPSAFELQIVLETTLGEAERQTGDLVKAKSLVSRALELAQKHYGLQDPRRATVLETLGKIHQDLGEYEEAETLFRQNMEATRRVSTTQSLEFIKCLKGYADLLRLMDRNREADNLEHRAEQITYKIRSV